MKLFQELGRIGAVVAAVGAVGATPLEAKEPNVKSGIVKTEKDAGPYSKEKIVKIIMDSSGNLYGLWDSIDKNPLLFKNEDLLSAYFEILFDDKTPDDTAPKKICKIMVQDFIENKLSNEEVRSTISNTNLVNILEYVDKVKKSAVAYKSKWVTEMIHIIIDHKSYFEYVSNTALESLAEASDISANTSSVAGFVV